MFVVWCVFSLLSGLNFDDHIKQNWSHNDMMFLRIIFYGNIWKSIFYKENNGVIKIPTTLRNSTSFKFLDQLGYVDPDIKTLN